MDRPVNMANISCNKIFLVNGVLVNFTFRTSPNNKLYSMYNCGMRDTVQEAIVTSLFHLLSKMVGS